MTLTPCDGAAPLRVIVPLELDPPSTLTGLRLTPVNATGVIVRLAVDVPAANVAVILAEVEAVT